MKVNNDIFLGIGNISMSTELGSYYQDFKPAIYHIENETLGSFDENGVPYLNDNGIRCYNIVYLIQYALIQHDLILENDNVAERKKNILTCVEWLDKNAEIFKDSLVWRSEANEQYNLEKGWISSMSQGHVISIYLRAYQLFDEKKYLEFATKAYRFFEYDFNEGGVKRIDNHGCIWFEEYPTDPASFVLNGFIYTIFGILDFYRVTQNKDAKQLYDSCVETLRANLYKYDVWYWSVYDQKKKQLVSYYYQKNVHLPLMQIMYQLTNDEIFNKYALKWEKNLNSSFNRLVVKVMYRIKHRLPGNS